MSSHRSDATVKGWNISASRHESQYAFLHLYDILDYQQYWQES